MGKKNNQSISFKEKTEQYEKKITNLALRKAKEEIYITFNFSFLTNNNSYNFNCKDCTQEHKGILIERLVDLSSRSLVFLTATTGKQQGLEKITSFGKKDKIKNMELHRKFQNSKRNELTGEEFWIFRLCPNNNPYETRIIGKMIDDVFYAMFIDYNHELYAKRN